MTYSIKFYENSDDFLSEVNLDEFNTDIYHTPEWIKVNANLEEGYACYILIESFQDKAYLPLVKREIIADVDYFDLTTPYGYGGVCFSHNCSSDFRLNVLNEVHKFLSKSNCVSLFLRLHPILNSDLNDTRYSFKNGYTLNVELNRNYEDIFKSYKSGHRYDIRKALKNDNITIVDDLDFEHYADFIKIYTDTMTALNASEFYFFSNDYFEKLKYILGKKLKLIIVKNENSVIGASLFMLNNGIMQYHLSGTTLEGRKFQPSKLILDYMINWGIENNFKYLHLGGGVGAAKDQLYDFKKGFSSTELEFSTIRMVTNQEKYLELCKEKNIPEGDVEDLSDFFPLYRK